MMFVSSKRTAICQSFSFRMAFRCSRNASNSFSSLQRVVQLPTRRSNVAVLLTPCSAISSSKGLEDEAVVAEIVGGAGLELPCVLIGVLLSLASVAALHSDP